jgi:hypothetical protein
MAVCRQSAGRRAFHAWLIAWTLSLNPWPQNSSDASRRRTSNRAANCRARHRLSLPVGRPSGLNLELLRSLYSSFYIFVNCGKLLCLLVLAFSSFLASPGLPALLFLAFSLLGLLWPLLFLGLSLGNVQGRCHNLEVETKQK